MPRLPDWDRRLNAVTEKHLRLPGEWGASDCLLTVMDAVEAVTGIDPAAGIRGRYKTEAGAARLLRKHGHADVRDALASLFPEIGRLMAQRGDVGVIEQGGAVTAGYVTERGFASKGPAGLIFRPQTEIIVAFAVR